VSCSTHVTGVFNKCFDAMVMLYGKSYRKRASEIIEHFGRTPVPKTNREDLSPGTYSNDSREYAVESSRSFARNPWKNADQRRTVSVAHSKLVDPDRVHHLIDSH